MNSEVLDRFVRYAKIHTTSKDNVKQVPSTQRQFDLAKLLVKELKEIGIYDAKVNEYCIVSGTLKSNFPDSKDHKMPVICFIAHLDTSPDVSGKNVCPTIVEYKGGDINIGNNADLVIKEEEIFPPIHKLNVDRRIITSDGNTLLGADNKAGIAEIMTAISKIKSDPDIKHGDIRILFTPDEEVGTGISKVDLMELNSDYAYTIDGGRLGEFETECFNAANGNIEIHGVNVHAGYAYGKMVNALRVLPEIIRLFPEDEAPETTKDREGYFHPNEINGNVESVKLSFLLRDFDFDRLENKINLLGSKIDELRERHPETEIIYNVDVKYRNMKNLLNEHPNVTNIAERAINMAGIEIINVPIRGGTDGAQLTFRGLPTPNVFSGGINFHSRNEFIPVYSMEKAVEVIINIVKISVEVT